MIAVLAAGLLRTVVVLFAVVTACFVLSRALPGDPFDDGRALDPAVHANLLAEYGLDQPLPVQYARTLGGLLRLDFGPCLKMRDVSVNDVLAAGLPVSAGLGCWALLLALLVGLPAGALAAARRGGLTDTLVMALATVGLAVPNFVLASALVLVFVFALGLLPVAGLGGPQHLLLPSLALGLPFAASVARLFRSGLLEVLGEDWVRTAAAKGLSPLRVVLGHAARPALLPVVSFLGPAAAGVLTGSLVIEEIFALPGIGRHFVEAALNADYHLASGVVTVYALLVCLCNLAVDVLYGLLDPRIARP